jgi:hypothetical protein
VKIPPLDSYSTRRVALQQKQAEFHVKITALKAEGAVIRARLQKGEVNPGNEAERRLSDILGETPVVASLPDPEQLLTIQKELEVLNAANAAIDAAIQAETRFASDKMLEHLKPEIIRLGNEFAKAFLALRDKHLAFIEFTDSIEDAGGSVSAIRIRPAGLSDPRDRTGNYQYGLREFAEAGYINPSLAPKVI